MSIHDYFRALARHHVWATQRLLDDLVALTDDEWHRDAALFFHSVHHTVNHLLVTDDIWYARLAENRSPHIALDAELHTGRAAADAALRTAVARWDAWLAALDPARFDGEIAYTRNNGQPVRTPFAPTLGHVFNHATHHRGQISAAVTAFGRPGPVLDWVAQLQQEMHAR